MKELNSAEDFSVYVAFHITDETSSSASVSRLDRLMETVFGDTQSCELVSEDWGHQEVIYKIQKPVLVSNDAMSIFFDKLKQIFIAASSMSPHFTQLNGDANRGVSGK